MNQDHVLLREDDYAFVEVCHLGLLDLVKCEYLFLHSVSVCP